LIEIPSWEEKKEQTNILDLNLLHSNELFINLTGGCLKNGTFLETDCSLYLGSNWHLFLSWKIFFSMPSGCSELIP